MKTAINLLLAAIVLVLAFTFTPKAKASELLPSTVGLHLVSHHMHTPPEGQPGFNNANHGIYARWDNGITAGTLVNSLNRRSNYLAWTGERQITPRISVAITAGAISGYDTLVTENHTGPAPEGQHTDVRCNAQGQCRQVLLKPTLTPLFVPSVAAAITPRLRARLSWLVKTHADSANALHLSAEWSF